MTRRKPLASLVPDGDVVGGGEGGALVSGLQKQLTVWDLIFFGVGTTVGAGIYSLLGPATAVAGPGIVLSFVTGAISCALTGLAYAEFASRCPVSGSAYTYAYTTFGEGLAWVIGRNLTLEYSISAAAISRVCAGGAGAHDAGGAGAALFGASAAAGGARAGAGRR